MSRTAIVLATGVLCVAVGIVALLEAHEFSTTYSPYSGSNTDSAKETGFRIIGSSFLLFGFGMVALASYRWIEVQRPKIPL
jgi:hypothetical protein